MDHCEKDHPVFSNTGQSNNLKTNLEKMTKKTSIYLQRARGKSSLASYRSFQIINKTKNQESNLSQLSEQPPSPQTMTLWSGSGRAGGLSPAWQLLPTPLCLLPRKTSSITLTQPGQPPRWVLCQQPAEGLRRSEQAQSIMSVPRIISHLHKL